MPAVFRGRPLRAKRQPWWGQSKTGVVTDTTVCDGGSYTVTGGQGDFPVHAADGSYALTGGTATFVTTLVCDGGSYALTGGDASHGSALVCDGGSYALTGGTAGFANALPLDGGAYTLTGGEASHAGATPDAPTQRGDGGGAAVAKRSKREEDPRSAMERLLARVRERWAARDEPEAVEVAEEAQPAPEPLERAPSVKQAKRVVAAAPVDLQAQWNALLAEIDDEVSTRQAVEAIALLQAMARRRREDEDEEEVLMLLLAD